MSLKDQFLLENSSPTAHFFLALLDNTCISRPTYFHCHSKARNSILLVYYTLHYYTGGLSSASRFSIRTHGVLQEYGLCIVLGLTLRSRPRLHAKTNVHVYLWDRSGGSCSQMAVELNPHSDWSAVRKRLLRIG